MLAKFLRILANFCESTTNKANGLRFFFLLLLLLFFLHFIKNALRMRASGLPTLASTCKCLRMTYNALLIPSDFNANIAHSPR